MLSQALQKKIRFLVLGTSPISRTMAQAIVDSSTGMLVSVGGRDLNKVTKLADDFGLQNYGPDYDDLIASPDIDAVYIGLPNHLHKEYIIKAARAGKHILCEKPFVISEAECREVIAAVNQAKVFCMEALMYRCHPLTTKLHEIVDSKVIGDIHLFTATYTADFVKFSQMAKQTESGGIRNLGCYPVSSIRALAKCEPVAINGMGGLDLITHADTVASTYLTFANGMRAYISVSDSIKKAWNFEIHGSKGTIRLLTCPWMPEPTNKIMVSLNDDENTSNIIEVQADKPLYSYQIDVLGKAVITGDYKNHTGMSLEDSFKNVQVLEAWRKQVIDANRAPVVRDDNKAENYRHSMF